MASLFLSIVLLAGIGQSDVTLLFFTLDAENCEPCVQMEGTLQRMYGEGWDVRKIDVQQRRDLASEYTIENLPTVVLMAGGQEVDRLVGVSSYQQLSQRVGRVAARFGDSSKAPRANSAKSQQPIVRGQSPGVAATTSMAVSAVSSAGSVRPPVNTAELRSPVRRNATEGQTGGGPILNMDQAMARASAATVRIRVDEGQTTAHGTGTVVHVHGNEALVLTCGHLFRDMQPASQLSVDLFAGTPRETNVSATLIEFRAEEEDIALISFRPPVSLEPVGILPPSERLRIGQRAFSYGCDHGQDPTRRDTHITNVNRYVGAANVEIAGAPAVGRSGGGLFDTQGRLIGVCNAADANDDEGIYASGAVIYDQLERIGLLSLIEEQPSSVQLASAASANAQQPKVVDWPDAKIGPRNTMAADSGQQNADEVICIFRDASGQSRMLTIQQPDQELLQLIENAVQQ